MPITVDKRPGRKSLRRNGEAAGLGKPPGGPDVLPKMMRIRIVRGFASRAGSFRPGQTAVVEQTTARSWIGFGLAEEDKSFDGAPETK